MRSWTTYRMEVMADRSKQWALIEFQGNPGMKRVQLGEIFGFKNGDGGLVGRRDERDTI
jgi:uncharacterized protein YkvS